MQTFKIEQACNISNEISSIPSPPGIGSPVLFWMLVRLESMASQKTGRPNDLPVRLCKKNVQYTNLSRKSDITSTKIIEEGVAGVDEPETDVPTFAIEECLIGSVQGYPAFIIPRSRDLLDHKVVKVRSRLCFISL